MLVADDDPLSLRVLHPRLLGSYFAFSRYGGVQRVFPVSGLGS